MKHYRSLPIYISFCVVLLFSVSDLYAVEPPSAEVSARLLLDHQVVQAGQSFQAVIFLTHLNDWHTYWVNPGDSGLPTNIQWTLPTGFIASAPRWPYPERFFTEGITNYGYTGMVATFTTIQAPQGFGEGVEVSISANVSWLACREICIPQTQKVSVQVAIGSQPVRSETSVLELMNKMSSSLPKNDPSFVINALEDPQYYWLHVVNASKRIIPLTDMYFFDSHSEHVDHSSTQSIYPSKTGVFLKIPKRYTDGKNTDRLKGALVIHINTSDQQTASYAIEIDAETEDADNWPELRKLQTNTPFKFKVAMMAVLGLVIGFSTVRWLYRRRTQIRNLVNK